MSKLFQLFADIPLGKSPFVQTISELSFSLLITLSFSGMMILIYRLVHDSLSYNRKFSVTLPMLALASNLLLALIQNNPLFSLGALGALSICRIRTNTKDPRDLGFVFWALTIGISSALGEFAVGLVGTIALSLVMLLLGRTTKKKDVLTMVIRGDKKLVASVQDILCRAPGSSIQSKNLFQDSFELVYELRISQTEEERLAQELGKMDGIYGINVLAPQTKVA
jgi:hypothetical protein